MASITCRTQPDAKPHPHACSEWHSNLVLEYGLAKHAQELRAEAWSLGYATELQEFYRDVEVKVTFKAWLQQHKRDEEVSSTTTGTSADSDWDEIDRLWGRSS